MKWRASVGAAVCLLALAVGSAESGQESYPELDAKYGFRDLSFEQECSDNWRRLEDFDGAAVYERPGDELKIGDIPVDSIRYYCAEGRLAEVGIMFQTHNLSSIVATMEAKYGKPQKSMAYYTWDGERVRASALSTGRAARLSIESTAMNEAMERAKQAVLQEATDDL